VSGERRLDSVRVLLTRPKERSEALTFLLEDEGATVLSVPLLEILPPEDPRPLASAAENIHRYAWVLFASPSAVEALVEATREAGTLDRLRRCKVGAVGPKTAAAARHWSLEVTQEAELSTGPGLLEALKNRVLPDDEVLLPVAQDGRRELVDGLEAQNIACTRVAAYRSSAAQDAGREMFQALAGDPPHVIVFASPRTLEAFVEKAGEMAMPLLEGSTRVAIGPTTAGALGVAGYPPHAVAESPTSEGLLEAVVQAVRNRP